MTTQEQYEQIKRAVVEAVPELEHLNKLMKSYGYSKKDFAVSCKFDDPKIYWEILPPTATEAIRRDQFENHIKLRMEEKIRELEREILGRDIRLADVLFVLEERLSKAGAITKDSYYESFAPVCEIWNLQHDSLEWHRDNAPETIAFLYKILVNE